MWKRLAAKRAWNLLNPVLQAEGRERAKQIHALYDHWVAAAGDLVGHSSVALDALVEAVRQRKKDRDVEPFVGEWATWYAGEVASDTVDHAKAHVRYLLPAGVPRLVSQVTTDWLTQQLTAYDGKRNTRRKVHSHWTGFFGYLTQVHKLWLKNPMDDVARPSVEVSPIRFYEQDVVERIVGWQPTLQ